MSNSAKITGLLTLAALCGTTMLATPAVADGHMANKPGHHGAAHQSQTIVQAAIASPDHSTLVAAVQAAGLVETLSGPGPFTVFAPTNAAFAKLPAGTVETLVKPENKATLANILTYHVVAGRVTATDLMRMIRAGRGKAILTTVAGGKLTARRTGRGIVLIDAKGGRAKVVAADLIQSNGVIHATDSVSLPG